MARIVLIRSNPVAPDPPVEKAVNALLGAGYQITVLGWDRAKAYKQSVDEMLCPNGVAQIVRFGIPAEFSGGIKKNAYQLLLFQKCLYSWLSKHRSEYDAIHAFDFDTGFIAAYCARKYHKKLVYHILDYYVDSHKLGNGLLKSKVEQLERRIINSADATIICTEKRKEQIAGTNPRRLLVVHNTPDQIEIDTAEYHQVLSSPCCKIAYIGILCEGRLLREIISKVQSDARFELHIGGYGELEDVVKNAAMENERIKFYGKLPYAKTLALEACCDVMVAIYHPGRKNHQYAAHNKFYESLMMGKPIIMARNTGFDEIIGENGIGYLIDYSSEGLKEGLDFMLQQKAQWSDMSTKSKQLYHAQYSWSIMQTRIVGLYKELLN